MRFAEPLGPSAMNLQHPSNPTRSERKQAILRRRGWSLLILISGLLSLLPSLCRAEIVISIDISNPSAVVITATSNNYTGTAITGGSVTGQGIILSGFFGSATGVGNAEVSALGTPTFFPASLPTGTYDRLLQVAGGSEDANVFELLPPYDTQTFATNAAPFRGTMTADLSNNFGTLPGIGESGSVTVGGTMVGTWSVVPEPATFGLTGALLLGWCLYSRHRTVRS